MSYNQLNIGVAMNLLDTLSDEKIEELAFDGVSVNDIQDMVYTVADCINMDDGPKCYNISDKLSNSKKFLVQMVKKHTLPVDLSTHKEFMDLYYNGVDENMTDMSYKEL